jgi:hypothetical protein
VADLVRVDSAVADFRGRLVAYEDQHATLPRRDLVPAVLSSLALLEGALFVRGLPSAHAVRAWDVPFAAHGLVGAFATALEALALPLALLAAAGLAVDLVIALRTPRLPIGWHLACAAQPVLLAAATLLAVALLVSIFWWFMIMSPILIGLVFCGFDTDGDSGA